MKLKRIIVVGLCLVVSMGLVLVNMGMCQQDKPGEKAGQAAAPCPEGTQKPAAAPKGKGAKPPKEQSKPAGAAATPATPQKSADPGKLPGQFTPSEGC